MLAVFTLSELDEVIANAKSTFLLLLLHIKSTQLAKHKLAAIVKTSRETMYTTHQKCTNKTTFLIIKSSLISDFNSKEQLHSAVTLGK